MTSYIHEIWSLSVFQLKCQLFFFLLTTNQKFDIAIMSVILMNMITMSAEHYGQSQDFEDVLKYVNQVFIAIFTLECVMKILGLRWYYFKQPWNVFDFVVVLLSVFGKMIILGTGLDHLPLWFWEWDILGKLGQYLGPPSIHILPPNLVKSRSREIGCYNNHIALKFDRHFGSAAA